MATKPKKSSAAPAKKPVAKKPVEKAPVEKKVVKHVPPHIVRKPTPVVKTQTDEEAAAAAAAKAVADAMSIAQELKRAAAAAAERETEEADNGIRLTRRPTSRTQGKEKVEKFPASDLKEFRKRLLAAREQAVSGASAMKATGLNGADDHEADGGDGTDQTLRLQALGQVGTINRTLQQIDEALHRIDDGTYGVCTSCGQLIRKARLLNQPFVLTCMECQNEMERAAR